MAGKKGCSGRPKLMNGKEMVNVNVRLPREVQQKLIDEAKSKGVSLASVVRERIM